MHTYDTLEIKKGQHLHLTERFFIEKMIALGASHRRIGRLLDNLILRLIMRLNAAQLNRCVL